MSTYDRNVCAIATKNAMDSIDWKTMPTPPGSPIREEHELGGNVQRDLPESIIHPKKVIDEEDREKKVLKRFIGTLEKENDDLKKTNATLASGLKDILGEVKHVDTGMCIYSCYVDEESASIYDQCKRQKTEDMTIRHCLLESIHDLEEKNDALKLVNKALKEAYDNANQERIRLSEEIYDLSKPTTPEPDAGFDNKRDYEDAICELDLEISDLKNTLEEKNNEVNDLKNTLEEKNNEVDNLKKSLAEEKNKPPQVVLRLQQGVSVQDTSTDAADEPLYQSCSYGFSTAALHKDGKECKFTEQLKADVFSYVKGLDCPAEVVSAVVYVLGEDRSEKRAYNKKKKPVAEDGNTTPTGKKAKEVNLVESNNLFELVGEIRRTSNARAISYKNSLIKKRMHLGWCCEGECNEDDDRACCKFETQRRRYLKTISDFCSGLVYKK